MTTCIFCNTTGGKVIWQDDLCRVVLTAEPDYPGFCRVIARQHAKEMTDLPDETQLHIMQVVLTVERVMREILRPDKVNLASLGNMVAHVHWHIIPRYHDDPHFPASIWAAAQPGRQPRPQPAETLQALMNALQQALTRL